MKEKRKESYSRLKNAKKIGQLNDYGLNIKHVCTDIKFLECDNGIVIQETIYTEDIHADVFRSEAA